MIRYGSSPFLECSSRGDRRFSAFSARIRQRGNRSIEALYQAAKIFEDGSTGLSWRAAKGRKAVNAAEAASCYAILWNEYIAENPHLLQVLRSAPGLQDQFGQRRHCCQATELWRIRNAASHTIGSPMEPPPNSATQGTIRLGNKRAGAAAKPRPGETIINIDRTNPILGNPYVLKDHRDDAKRAQVIALYKTKYDADIARRGPMTIETEQLAERIRKGERLILMCWCAGPPMNKPCPRRSHHQRDRPPPGIQMRVGASALIGRAETRLRSSLRAPKIFAGLTTGINACISAHLQNPRQEPRP